MNVAFVDFVFETREDIRLEGCEFSIHPPLRTAAEIVAAASGAEVLCMRDQFGRVTPEVLEQLPDLALIVTRSAGYDHIDLDEAKRRGIAVCNVPDYGAHMIAEHAFGLLLAVARNVVEGNNRYKHQRLFSDRGLQGIELHGKTLGIVGTGRIGLHSARIARGFGMRVLAYDLYENRAAAGELGFEPSGEFIRGPAWLNPRLPPLPGAAPAFLRPDESFVVYDHPRALVFRNAERLPADELLRRLGVSD